MRKKGLLGKLFFSLIVLFVLVSFFYMVVLKKPVTVGNFVLSLDYDENVQETNDDEIIIEEVGEKNPDGILDKLFESMR